MAWIESHPELESHPKIYDLMGALNIDLDQAIGKIHRFWWWCTKYAEDGDLRKHNDDRLARAVGLNGGQEATRFVEAMVASCWIDREPYFRVHDWWDYFGYFLMRKYGDSPEKWKRIKGLYVTVQGTVQEPSAPSLAVPTKPNQPNQQTPKPPTGAFDLIWSRYPNRDGKKAAERHFRSSVKTMTDWLDMQKALENYLASETVRKGFIKNGSTWFNNWKDWVNYDAKGINHARTNIAGGGYIGAPTTVGKYAAVTENRIDPEVDPLQE